MGDNGRTISGKRSAKQKTPRFRKINSTKAQRFYFFAV